MNRRTDTEAVLLQRAIETLAATTGVQMRIIALEDTTDQVRVDALANIEAAGETRTYAVETKAHLTIAKIGLVVEQLKTVPHKGMLVTDYVNPDMAMRLKEMDLAFIDLAGNAYINEPPIFIYIKGNRPTDAGKLGADRKPTRAFHATGLKVLFGLLTQPALIDKPYREIAETTDVALGTVGWVFTELRTHGLLHQRKGKKRQLIQIRKIIDQWVTAYPERLLPKLRLGQYRALNHLWWKEVHIETHNAQWGGEVAAAKLTNYLKPDTAIVYADAIPTRLLAEYQLRVDPHGDVEILQRFWNNQQLNHDHTDFPHEVAPPLLVYADLIATADDRNIETAHIIRDRYVDGYIRQD